MKSLSIENVFRSLTIESHQKPNQKFEIRRRFVYQQNFVCTFPTFCQVLSNKYFMLLSLVKYLPEVKEVSIM